MKRYVLLVPPESLVLKAQKDLVAGGDWRGQEEELELKVSWDLPGKPERPEWPDLPDREEQKEKWESQDREECRDRPESPENQYLLHEWCYHLQNKPRDEGGNTNFYCTAGGNPRPRVEWRFKGRKLQSGSKHWIKDDAELNIKHLNYSDVGQYTCVATNILGSHQASGNLTVRGEIVSVQITLPLFSRSSKRNLNPYRFYLIAQAWILNSKYC